MFLTSIVLIAQMQGKDSMLLPKARIAAKAAQTAAHENTDAMVFEAPMLLTVVSMSAITTDFRFK